MWVIYAETIDIVKRKIWYNIWWTLILGAIEKIINVKFDIYELQMFNVRSMQ